ncbi:2'-5' RNA ligase family protein [Saccharopolyspora mangrovi]|uniref:2'-5' RNA ligase family protein n=1 Tax=Saccharopolyspora mangrovi TaxID=3082379 RepID=A0ABU6ABG5_9PSEU|nr:2'-5' RNA ligase family protein [Saccharopolyspora sp. S2-29]MEB3368890.1 2'-5' RNA ligase family protein [Saccharopolyspora sp. S2-29]
MAHVGKTGVVVPVPGAQPLLDAVAERCPDTVRTGVPAHLSLLYPFVPAAELDQQADSALTGVFARASPLSVTFAGIVRSGGFLALRPEPADGVAALASAVRSRWPEVVPYGGRYDADPHLTVAMRTTEQRAGAIERELLPNWVPLSAELREAWLVEFDGQWRVRSRSPFGAG